ncbi:hypothetical protein ACVI1L_000710 [Bradyrhizobium sp. USDA 4516]
MPRAQSTYRLLTRALRAAKDAGVIVKIEIEPDRMTITTVGESRNSSATPTRTDNEWDEVFDDDRRYKLPKFVNGFRNKKRPGSKVRYYFRAPGMKANRSRGHCTRRVYVRVPNGAGGVARSKGR